MVDRSHDCNILDLLEGILPFYYPVSRAAMSLKRKDAMSVAGSMFQMNHILAR